MVYWSDFVYSPPGFYGKDIIIDVLSAIVVLLIGAFSFRNYLMDKRNKKHLVLSSAFVLLGLSFIVKIATNLIIHNDALVNAPLSISIFGLLTLRSFTDVSAVGFLTHAFLTLFGFYLIYVISSRDELTMNYVIIAYFIVICTYFSRFNYFILYITALLFLIAITRRYFLAYKKTHYANTRTLGISFAIISLSQFVFIFTAANKILYIAAEIIQLVGYLFLLYTFMMVLTNARKKKQD